MKQNTHGYIFCSRFVLSKNFLCIRLDTEVFYNLNQVKKLDHDYFVGVRKLNNKNDDTSFIFNLKVDSSFTLRDWWLHPNSIACQYARSTDWITVKNPPLSFEITSLVEDMEYVEEALREDVTTPVIISNLSLQELEQKLDQAVLAENYELAAKIRDEISRKK
jgi:hypothetical protein